MAKWDGRIPWLNGRPLTYVEGRNAWSRGTEAEPGFEWRDNQTFGGTLKFLRFERGRSAVRAVCFSEVLGCEVEVFFRAFETLIPRLQGGTVSGVWTFSKHGANYGVIEAP